MKKWLFLILLFPLICVAQTYRYLGVEDGLSNRRVYCIQKDKTGYMWFLTHEGIDRYNGKEFKRYKLMDGDAEVNSLLNLNWLYIDQEGVLWEIGKKGKVFRYDQIHDCFSLVYKLPMESFSEQPDPVTYAWLDQNKHIWLCNKDTIFLYNTSGFCNSSLASSIRMRHPPLKSLVGRLKSSRMKPSPSKAFSTSSSK